MVHHERPNHYSYAFGFCVAGFLFQVGSSRLKQNRTIGGQYQHIFTGWMPFLSANQQFRVLSTDANQQNLPCIHQLTARYGCCSSSATRRSHQRLQQWQSMLPSRCVTMLSSVSAKCRPSSTFSRPDHFQSRLPAVEFTPKPRAPRASLHGHTTQHS